MDLADTPPPDWEMVTAARREYTDRLAVPGGWLYRTVLVPVEEGEQFAIAMVFVPARALRPGESASVARST